MNPYAGLNGLGSQNPAARLLQQANAGMPNGLTIQGSLPMDDMKAVWMQNQAGLMAKANAAPNLGAVGLAGAAAQQRMQLQGAGLQGLQQVANGGVQMGQNAGLGGMRLDNAAAGLAGMAGLGGQNQLQALQLQQLQQAQQQQQQAAQQAQAQQLLQQQLRQQQLQQQLQAQQQQQQQQAQLAQLRQQQLQQQQLQQLQQQQLLQQQQQQIASAGLQGNAGLMQGNLQALMGGGDGSAGGQFLLNQNAGGSAAQLANSQRQAELLAAKGLVGNQLQLQGGGGQGLTAVQQQQLLQQQLLKQAQQQAQQGVAASQGLQFGGAGVPQSNLLQQQLQANNAAQLRNLAQLNAQQDLARRQQQAQIQAAQQQQQAQLQLQQQLQRQQQLQQLQAAHAQAAQAQAAQAAVQQQSANQQAINAAAAMALRNANANEREQQLLRLMAAAAGKADTVGTLSSQLSTARTTAALAQRQLVAGLNAQQKAAALQGLAAAAGAGNVPPGGAGNAAATQAMLSQLLASNRPFEPNPARVGVIGQDRGKQPSTDLGGVPLSSPLAGTNPTLNSLAGAVSVGLSSLAPGGSLGPSRQMTPPPVSSPGAAAAAAAVAAAGVPGVVSAAAGNEAAALMGSGVGGLPLTASPENVEAFLKAVGKRFAAMGLTIEQALEFNILKGLTKEQLAVLSESQAAASTPNAGATELDAATAAALGAAAAAASGVSGQPVGLPSALTVPSEAVQATAPAPAAEGDAAPLAAAAAAGIVDDDDKILESLLEPEEKPTNSTVGQLDESTAAALLAMTQVDANFNAFTYGFFDDPSGNGGGLGDLLGELEPEGDASLEGDDAVGLGGAVISDLSELADFEPIDPAQLASWGSVDTAAADGAALAAALAAAGAHGSAGEAIEPVLGAVAEVDEKPAGAEAEAADVPATSAAEALASDLKGLSLGAGFE